MQTAQIIIDYEQDTTERRNDLLRHVDNLQRYFGGGATIEIMAYGHGLDLLLRSGGLSPEEAALPARLVACHNSLQARGLGPSSLIPGSVVVASGLGRITDRQLEGWAYIKA